MKQFEYIQLIRTAQQRTVFEDHLLAILHELCNIHKKYQDEMEYYLVYPNMNNNNGFKKAKSLAEGIVSLCKTHEIQFEFQKINTTDYNDFKTRFEKSKQFVQYYYNGKNITDLIVFIKPKKEDELVQDDAPVNAEDLDFGQEETGLPA